MFKKLIAAILLCAAVGSLFFLNAPVKPASAKVSPAQDGLLDATVQIIIQVRLKTGAHPEGEPVIGIGLGSLVRSEGETLIVTHNHWGEVLQGYSLVEFRDAENNLLARSFGNEFISLVRYQDKGTLILAAPEALLQAQPAFAARSAGSVGQVPDGATVQVAFRQPGNREIVTLQEAVVEHSCNCSGVRGFQLRSLSGQPLQKGDSGGGVWYNGVLVGNNWISVTANTPQEISEAGAVLQVGDITYTDRSFTAGIPAGQP